MSTVKFWPNGEGEAGTSKPLTLEFVLISGATATGSTLKYTGAPGVGGGEPPLPRVLTASALLARKVEDINILARKIKHKIRLSIFVAKKLLV
jgi:hypothetical protein